MRHELISRECFKTALETAAEERGWDYAAFFIDEYLPGGVYWESMLAKFRETGRDIESVPGSTGNFPDGKLNPTDESELKMVVSHNEKLVTITLGKAVAWFAMPKPQAITFAFTVLEHCGVKIEMQQLPAASSDPV